MRIAIITLPLQGNYGGILQNYALQKVLTDMEHTVETIRLPLELKLPLWKKPLSYGKRFLKKYILRRDCRIFYEEWYNAIQPQLIGQMQAFVKEHIHVRCVKDFSAIREGDYDAFVVGSDQIWRPRYFYWPITEAYLSFTKNWNKVRRVAYAVSFGTDEWEYSQVQTERCAKLAGLFDSISVREDSAVRLCKEYLHCEAVHVLDPTLLLSADDYIRLFKGKKLSAPRGQLLTYVLDETPEKSHIIQKVADNFHYKVYRANSRYEDMQAPLNERVQPPIEQWLKDFHDAQFVITDSFHATVFSILFGKPFIVIGNKERGLSRIYSLLKMFGLEKHVVHKFEDLNFVDYNFDNQQIALSLQSLRKKSINFLVQTFQDCGNPIDVSRKQFIRNDTDFLE